MWRRLDGQRFLFSVALVEHLEGGRGWESGKARGAGKESQLLDTTKAPDREQNPPAFGGHELNNPRSFEDPHPEPSTPALGLRWLARTMFASLISPPSDPSLELNVEHSSGFQALYPSPDISLSSFMPS